MESVDHFINYLLADKGYSQATANVYKATLVEVWHFMHNVEEKLTWATLDKDVLRKWLAHEMERGLSPRTVRKEMSAVRSFYRYLMRMELVETDPTRFIANPKAPKRLPTFVKQKEMDHLFDHVEFGDTYEGRRDRLIMLTFYSTGIRLAELLGLKHADVDLIGGELKVLGKRNKQRIVPFGAELQAAFAEFFKLKATLLSDSTDSVFVRANGRPMNPTEVRDIVRQYLSLVTQQQKKSPHVLRHTYATVMLNNGADLEAVKQLLGHESISTTEVYTHTTFSELKKEYEKAHPRA